MNANSAPRNRKFNRAKAYAASEHDRTLATTDSPATRNELRKKRPNPTSAAPSQPFV